MNRASLRVAVSGIDGSGKSTLCDRISRWLTARGRTVSVVGNLPRAYRRASRGVVDAEDPFLSSFFFNHALENSGDPGWARFHFGAQYVDYVMAMEEARLYHVTVAAQDPPDVVVHDRHILDRRVNAYRAGCPRADIDTILGYIPPPELTILLDISAQTAVQRVLQRGKPGRDENVTDLADYRELYRQCAATEPNTVLIDASPRAAQVFDTVLPHLHASLDTELLAGQLHG